MSGDRPLEPDAPTEVADPRTQGTEPIAPTSAPQLTPGNTLQARFRIVRLIARGGMGEVYEAVDTALGTRVALKTVRIDQAASERALQRFRREILLARKIGHPNVCRVFELHQGGAGEAPVFLTMELLEGETLAERLRRVGRLPEDDARKIILNVLSALSAAHAEGVIHRDLKASNVMLVPVPGAGERAVVTDFGIAHALGGFSDATATLDGVVGTPAYMAPEQVTGGTLTPATDLYSLGVMMFEMTSGRLPFSGDTSLAVAASRLQSSPPSLRRTISGVSRAWSDTTAWCLEREPARRPESAETVAKVLRGESRPRHKVGGRAGVLLGIGVLVLAIAVIGLRRWRTPAAPVVRPVAAVMETANLTGDDRNDWLSTAVSELLTSELEPTEGLRLVPASLVAERQFSLGAATSPSFPGSNEPRRLAESIGATFLVVPTLVQASPGGLQLEVRVRRPGPEPALATAAVTSVPREIDAAVHRIAEELRHSMEWRRGEPDGRSPLSPARPLPADPEARRAAVAGIRHSIRYDFPESRLQLGRALAIEPGFVQGIPLLLDAESDGQLPPSRDQAERALALGSALPDGPERLRLEAAALNALGRPEEAVERATAALARNEDDFELMLRRTFVAPETLVYQQLDAMRALPPPLGKDPRIDLSEAGNRVNEMDLPAGLRAVDRGLSEAVRRGDRMTTASLLTVRALVMVRLARIDEMARTYQEAEREALAAGSAGYARTIRLKRAAWLEAAGRTRDATALHRQLLAELPSLSEAWQAKRWDILLALTREARDIGDYATARKLIPQLKAAATEIGPGSLATLRRLEISDSLRSAGPLERERIFRHELEACGRDGGCKYTMGIGLAFELLAEGRGSEAEEALAPLGPLVHGAAARLYARVMTENGKAADAYAVLQPLMRANVQMRAEIGTVSLWQQNEALALCLLGMREVDQAASLVTRLAGFHRATEVLETRSDGLVLEAELALLRAVVPPELPGLLERQIAMAGMENLAPHRTELRMELGRLLMLAGREREARRMLTLALREATENGDLRIARLARAALQRS